MTTATTATSAFLTLLGLLTEDITVGISMQDVKHSNSITHKPKYFASVKYFLKI